MTSFAKPRDAGDDHLLTPQNAAVGVADWIAVLVLLIRHH
jgi:hypothetical protein